MQLIKKYERIAFDKFKIWISKRDITQLILILGFILGGLFIPVFVLGRRYQYGDNPPEKKQNKKAKSFLWIIIIVVFLLGICFGDITSITSAKKVMFWENTGTNYWNAEYQYFDGFMQRTLWMEEDDVLHVSVETDEGDFEIGRRDIL